MSAPRIIALLATLTTPCAAIAQVQALTHVNVIDVATLDRWADAIATNTDSPDEWYAVGRELYGARHYREAVAAFERGLTLRASGSSDEAWYIARAYAQLANRKQALRWLTHAQQLGFKDELAVGREPAFDKYRGDIRFRALVRPTGCWACLPRRHAGKTLT